MLFHNIFFVLEQKALDEEKEQLQKQLRKRQKQQEKQLKREAYEAMERQKKMMAEETDKALKGKKLEVLTVGRITAVVGIVIIQTLTDCFKSLHNHDFFHCVAQEEFMETRPVKPEVQTQGKLFTIILSQESY